MLLDGVEFNREPLAAELACEHRKDTGATDERDDLAAQTRQPRTRPKQVYIQMSGGSLPVQVVEVGSGQVPAEQGSMFKVMVIVAMILAQLAIGGIMYYPLQGAEDHFAHVLDQYFRGHHTVGRGGFH